MHIKKFHTLALLPCLVLFFLSFIFIFPPILRTGIAEATPLASTTNITLQVSHGTADLNITANNSAGNFATTDANHNIAFTVATNNLTGYPIAIAGNDNVGKLSNSLSGTVIDTLNSISSAVSAATFSSDTSYNGKWGYKPSKYNSLDNTDYLPAPTTTASILDVTNSAGSADYTIDLGARINQNKLAGAYTSTFSLVAVARPVPYQINYLDNTDATNLPAPEANSDAAASAITLTNATPTRVGYTFNKWCYGTVAHVASGNSTCDGTEYAAGSNFVFSSASATVANVANLYAMWNVDSYDVTVNFAGKGVSSVDFSATGHTTRAVTTSGGTASLDYMAPYTVTMHLNPDYEFDSWGLNNPSYGTISSTSINLATFTPNANSDNAVITATGKPIKYYMQDYTADRCSAHTDSSTTVWDKRDEAEYEVRYINGNCWMVQNLRYLGDTGSGANEMVISATTTNSDTDKTLIYQEPAAGNVYNKPQIHIGNNTSTGVWYSFAAASAGTITANSNEKDSTQDICPKNWHLPSRDEFNSLVGYKDAFLNGDLRVIDGDIVNDENVYYGGYYGSGGTLINTYSWYWWGSTRTGGGYMVSWSYFSSTKKFQISQSQNRGNAIFVRCVRNT